MGDFEETLLDGHATYSAVQKTRVGGSVVQVRTIGHPKPCPDPCAERPAPDVTTAIEYLHRDHLGSVEAVTDGDGDRLAVLAYDPYGERRSTDWTRVLNATEIETLADDLKLKVSRGHTGHEHLDRAGFVHMNGRIYDPRLGRFLSPDPVVSNPGSSQSWNSYSYVANSPMSFTDPSGLSQQPVNMCPPDICPWNGAAGGVGGGSSRVTQPVAAWQANVSAGFLVIPFPTFGYFGGEGYFGWASLVIPFASADVGKTTRGVVVHDTNPADEPLFSSRDLASIGVGVLPVVGSAQSVVEVVTGHDFITNEPVHRGVAAAGIIAGMVPGGKAGTKILSKLGDQAATEAFAKAGRTLDDDALVCRGGTCTADRFTSGTGVTTDSTGKLQGVSVNSAPGRSIGDLTANIPHNQVGVSTVGEIRQVGGQVVPSPTARNPYHATLSDLTPEDAERLFSPPIRNPNRR